MPLEISFIIFLIVINLVIILNYKYLTNKINVLDFPNEKRKIHSNPTPIFGGIIVFINIIFFLLLFFFFKIEVLLDSFLLSELKSLFYFFIIISSIFIIGLYDDKYTIKGINRIILLTLFIYFSIVIDLNLEINELIFNLNNTVIPFEKGARIFPTICFLVLIVSCNMGDGINLQSFLFNFFTFLGLYFITENLFIIVLLISLVSFGILNFNGKIFLGDSGSYLLSFFLGFYFIKYYNYNYIDNVEVVILFLLFPIMDASRCIFTRLLNGRSIISADNIHLHYMLLNKIDYKKTISLMSFFYLGPFVSYVLNFNYYLFFIISITLYIFLFLKFKS